MSQTRREFLFLSERQKKRRLAYYHKNKYTDIEHKVEESITNLENELDNHSVLLSPLRIEASTSSCFNPTNLPDMNCLNPEISPESDSSHSVMVSSDSSESELGILDKENSSNLNKNSLGDDLRLCFIKHHANQNFINNILSVLRGHGHDDLPKDSRTLMNTPRNVKDHIIYMNPGKYIHFGLIKNLKYIIQHTLYDVPSTINFNINIDGLPLTKSSGSQFWPILGDIPNISSEPFVIGLYHGTSKPDNCNQFLDYFVQEFKPFESNPVIINDKSYVIKLNFITADAPAKAFITNTKGHNAYFGCSKCTCEGKYVDKVVFLDTNAALRTDNSFRNRLNKDHHKSLELTTLESLQIDMIKQLPIDYMHLVLLGNMKKLLAMWVKGNIQVRLKKPKILTLDELYLSTKKYIPTEFSRKPRTILDLERWKATEFRLFLLYIAPVILQQILSKEAYRHFLSLSVSIRLLCDKKSTPDDIEYAHSLLIYYVKKFKYFYGENNVTYNVHNLIHIADDVKNYGTLDSFSAFKFENFMHELKKLVKHSRNPLQQVANRIEEKWTASIELTTEKYPKIFTNSSNIISVQLEKFKLSADEKDCCIIMKDKSNISKVVKILGFSDTDGKIKCFGKEYKNTMPVFNSPCNSQILGIELVGKQQLSDDCMEFCLDSIVTKCVRVPINNDFAVVPLLH